ncbi:protein PXR1 [Hirsutella rhossiliensis]|uniref:PinX1-related protein 1 n=1 Tax=Hirsutella rhossiliensis TaxID=111463 RepID=A0A9P8SLC6_9HYPO|nr:protein PXR1 [Hirsutella rhossiliensis]KAH0967338.1 protein PXR1 [Hirsutella rhossiliensis]
MGLLAESKSRRKISKDPNNTKWTRDTSTFGQKILRAQGWEPGQYLGAKDAGHSNLHTAANASYIRVSLKDDMKGLGFNKAKEDEVTGLNVFSDLLSRLNGKSEEDVEGDRRARLEMKTNVYVEQKWGVMRFVKGGLLTDEKRGTKDKSSKKERKSKKRKLADADEEDAEAESKKERKRRKEERRARKASAESAPDSTEDANQSSDAKAKKKAKKEKSSPGDDVDAEQDQPGFTDDGSRKKARKSKSKDKKPDPPIDEDPVKAGKRSKDKKEKNRRKKMDAEPADSKASESAEQEDVAGSATATGASTPTGSGTGTSTPKGGRNFARSRFIAAKRQAMLDAKSLNQIFMIKT